MSILSSLILTDMRSTESHSSFLLFFIVTDLRFELSVSIKDSLKILVVVRVRASWQAYVRSFGIVVSII